METIVRIYEFRDFPNPRRVRVFLAEKGVSVPFEQVNVPEGEHRSPNFLAKNPYAAVPTLELEDGTCISETVAICRYFEERHPAPALMGATAREKAEIDMWQRRIESTIMNPVEAYFHHATPGLGSLETYQNEAWGRKNRETALAAISRLDAQLGDKPFIAGETISIADVTGLCALDFAALLDIEVPEDCGNVKRWHAALSSRPSAAA